MHNLDQMSAKVLKLTLTVCKFSMKSSFEWSTGFSFQICVILLTMLSLLTVCSGTCACSSSSGSWSFRPLSTWSKFNLNRLGTLILIDSNSSVSSIFANFFQFEKSLGTVKNMITKFSLESIGCLLSW
ncbi:hypothetical protein OGATHE_004729 [Ogataea polymorpha]|uniref:Uncharacterized protein n=1 Tax=Ogataea polymorpha TaxID=460523 RepID=A0A9P8T1T6_9ASCO|nr:hypothetical protein OGATHE_004729 [Ogataea polymorpha]